MKSFRTVALAALMAAAGLATADEAPAAPPIPWKMPSYTLVARDMDLRVALDTFAVAQGLSVVMSQAVAGRFSGDFKDVPPGEFLDRIATTHNLMWYYDGAALYVYGAGEISTMLVDLRYMKAAEVRQMLAELGVEDRRFPLKTTSNDELVMVSGPPRYVSLVAEMIAKADSLREKRTFNEVEARIFPLVYTWADDVTFTANSPESSLQLRGVARMLEEIMSSGGTEGVREAALTNEMSRLDSMKMSEYRPVIRPDNRLNAVIVRDVVSRMPMYETLIRQLDVPQKLVEIDITVVELSRKDALDWQLSLALNTRHGHSDFGAGQNASSLFSPENIAAAGKGLAGALTHVHAAYAVASSITALREKGKARSISRTSLLTVNNLAAEMSDSQSYHAKVVGTEVATLEEVSAGTRLQVKPRILPSVGTNVPDQVWLSLELDDGGFESITVDAMPMKRSSTLTTQTAVFVDESIMLAGYLRDIEEDAGWGIPYLRDIPWIGWIFGGKSTRKETVQRMFVITPHIVDIDRETLARFQATRLRDVVEAEEMQDDAEMSDDERKKRDLERSDNRERRKEMQEDHLSRRKAEIEHGREMRQIERERKRQQLIEEIRKWKAEEETERAKAEEQKSEGQDAEQGQEAENK
ncbi:MAG: type III secretion system outer membrane ring subunit SctC [Kiritimatiellae bacterium]|nr:type III secretion system outer membrane ring subunit SctC [Kiritimatiellia bacterium]